MTYHWTEADIIPGRWVCKPTAYHHPDRTDANWQPDGGTAKWTYQIGWLASGTTDKNLTRTCVVDGMISKPRTRAELAAQLTKEGLIPMPHKWLLATIDHLRDCQVAT